MELITKNAGDSLTIKLPDLGDIIIDFLSLDKSAISLTVSVEGTEKQQQLDSVSID